MNVIALMVAIEDYEEIYVSVQMDIGTEEPTKNNPTDIRRCVDLFNTNEDTWTYIDMFGIIKDGKKELWGGRRR